jgi:hypothetical protein
VLLRPFFLTIWRYIDPIYFALTRLEYPCSDRKKEGVFRVRLTRYKGKDVVLSDGTAISKNDLLLKIHLHNVKLLRNLSGIKNELSKGKAIFQQILDSMPLLTAFILNHPEAGRIKGIIGITLIDKGFERLGFECFLPESKLYSWYKKTLQIPIYLLSCSKISLRNIKKHHPVYLMMSKEKLFETYKNPD